MPSVHGLSAAMQTITTQSLRAPARNLQLEHTSLSFEGFRDVARRRGWERISRVYLCGIEIPEALWRALLTSSHINPLEVVFSDPTEQPQAGEESQGHCTGTSPRNHCSYVVDHTDLLRVKETSTQSGSDLEQYERFSDVNSQKLRHVNSQNIQTVDPVQTVETKDLKASISGPDNKLRRRERTLTRKRTSKAVPAPKVIKRASKNGRSKHITAPLSSRRRTKDCAKSRRGQMLFLESWSSDLEYV